MNSNSMGPYWKRNGYSDDLYAPGPAGPGLADSFPNGAQAQRSAFGRILPDDEFELFR
jgi:hypothetical protein